MVNYNGRFDLLEQPWVTFGLRTIESSLALENGDLKLMDQALAKPHYFKILDSLELLRGCCAEAWEEVTGLLTTCVFVQSTSLRSSSVPSTFGAIYISPKHDWVIPNYIDLLVHESSHYSLYIKSKLAKFLNNPTQLAKSPLRDDRRPLIAVLHAVYVLVRVSFVLKRWIELDYPNRDVASELYEQYRLKAKHGLTVLHDTGEWTVDGVELLRNFDKSVGSITDY
ncbi:hypothetical protein ATW55_15450 [Ferroacidibacillus organovorans]|uniref:HEXXH motif domain-containing protein n=2 Tax=Ferroacidibacillus organovorans TaxID=1765683 RepID=A0A101XP13_9BACL|nr:hypothetical protein ATW55_15450 [Ferroacidibacillus organovorans]